MLAPEPRACSACSKTKRKCSRELPSCSRCQSRDLECVYPAPRPSCFVLCGDDPLREDELPTPTLSALELPPTPSDLMPSCSGPLAWPTLSDLQEAWFLTRESWTVQPLDNIHLTPTPISVGWRYVNRIRGWLADWTTGIRNPLIHSRLYETRLPNCIQDAFMALSSYHSRTPATEEFVYRILESRAESLVAESSESDAELDCFDHVSRVQALVVYSSIRLFDSDIRQRYLAEQQLPRLYAWSNAMLSHAAENRHLLLSSALEDIAPGLTQPVSAMQQEEVLWRAWIRSESIRRTWLVAQMLHAVYLTMQGRYVGCPGGVMFTNRKGAWEAESAHSWMKLCAEKNVGFMHRSRMYAVMEEYRPDEVDEFGKSIMELDFGVDRMENWGC
ncbi:hypothetical protein P170DRAFT_397273 [Aspergillus steynii IBT 23096]|uniref:Zn(2)-C6 fungal-type domain-containing protein n=1 Tax=Aspergillus steynii IBT 23096 TaxID=1392250 RepID=A0A2I2GMT1_9EURO|nr:uncharacterized protein P170DRAFT_397273 [Aspergillus steynii IBT 23096]PLB54174.1 hypothetical protein P170DRAFT_397273 [Aspergillus steynii IBT 23096]